jgi:hypothetical protein
MGKNKQQNRKPDEQLLGENRLQRKQIKRLNQEIKRLEKLLGYRQNKIDDQEINEFEVLEPDCPECKIGFLKELELVGRKLKFCICGYRTRAIKI